MERFGACCGNPNLRTKDVRQHSDHVRRRRECRSCGARFTTYELPLELGDDVRVRVPRLGGLVVER